jgi:hypothetical protein
MATDLSGPADTSMMRIVHTALRRDIARAQAVLTEPPYPDQPQRAALGAHLQWMIGFLHRHHESEDTYLYPAVREANPGAGGLLDEMDADHEAIQPAMAAVTRTAARYEREPEGREELLAALGSLADVLLPHLRREEDELMPVVSATITEQQWRDWDQANNVKPLGPRELAFTGNWLLDGLDAGDQAIVAALVPPVPRWVIRRVLVRGYRRAMFGCWRLPEHTRLKASLAGTASVHAGAPAGAVWAVLADVTRVGEWSHECHSATWTDGSTRAAVGARFLGSNRSGLSRWSRSCTISACEAPAELGYCTEGRLLGDATEWLFTLQPDEGGTRIVQRYRVRRLPVWADRLLWRVTPAHHDRHPALFRDLERLAALAEREHALTAAVRPATSTPA